VVDDSPFPNLGQLNGAERPSRRILASVSGPGGGKSKKTVVNRILRSIPLIVRGGLPDM
jgi:hypothetical protein